MTPWDQFKSWSQNPNYLELRNQILGNEIIVITGTGTSRQLAEPINSEENEHFTEVCSYLSWHGLIAEGYKEKKLEKAFCTSDIKKTRWHDNVKQIEERENLSSDEYLYLAQTLQYCGNDFDQWINDIFSKKGFRCNNYALAAALESLNAPIITTNYDNLLSDALDREPISPIDGDKDLFEKFTNELHGRKRYIYHLHGHYESPNSLIFGYSSYQTLVEAKKQMDAKIAVLGARNLLLVGVGAGGTDMHWQFILRTLIDLGASGHIYWLIAGSSKDQIESLIEDEFGNSDIKDKIHLITYSEHDHLPLVLLSLRKTEIIKNDPHNNIFSKNLIAKQINPLINIKKIFRAKEKTLLSVGGPGGVGKTTQLQRMVEDLEPHCFFWSFNIQGFNPTTTTHGIPQLTSRLFFETALETLGFDNNAIVVWSSFLLKFSTHLSKEISDALSTYCRNIEYLDNKKSICFKDYINTFLKFPGLRAELLLFLLIQHAHSANTSSAGFVLFLDGLEPLQGGYTNSNDNQVPSANILDKEILIFLRQVIDSEISNLLVVTTSRYKPKIPGINKLERWSEIEIWGITENNFKHGSIFTEDSIRTAIQRNLYIKIDNNRYMNPLLLSILQNCINTKYDIDHSISTYEESSNLYTQVHNQITRVIEEFILIEESSLESVQNILRKLAYFDYAISAKDLRRYKLVNDNNEFVIDPNLHRGLYVRYGNTFEDYFFDIHPLARKTISTLLKKNPEQYRVVQKKIANEITPKSDDINIAFRKTQHLIEAGEYEEAQETFQNDIQEKQKNRAMNNFGLHLEILSLLNRFYIASDTSDWDGGIHDNNEKINSEWASKVNAATAHSLMSIGKPNQALLLEEKSITYFRDRIGSHPNSNGDYINSLMRLVDMKIYCGNFNEAAELAEQTINELDDYIVSLNKDTRHWSYLFWKEITNGRYGYALSWKSMQETNKSQKEILIQESTKYFKRAETAASHFYKWRKDNGIKESEYYRMPHIIWRERYDALQLRQFSTKTEKEINDLRNKIAERKNQFKQKEGEERNLGRLGYYVLNCVNLASLDFRKATNSSDIKEKKNAEDKNIYEIRKYKNEIGIAITNALVAAKLNFQLYALTSALWHLHAFIKLNSRFLETETNDVIEAKTIFDDFMERCQILQKEQYYPCYEKFCSTFKEQAEQTFLRK